MSGLFRKAKTIGSKPETAIGMASRRTAEFLYLVRNRRFGTAGSFVCRGVTGWSPADKYLQYWKWRAGRFVRTKVTDTDIVVDLDDGGISRDLFLYGTREQFALELFIQELQAIRDETDDSITVLEIGANIGYFVLNESTVLEAGDEIIAFEPDERNYQLLLENVRQAGVESLVTAEKAAVGTQTGTGTLQLSDHSNLNRLESSTTDTDRRDVETTTVDVWEIDDYIAEHDIDAESVCAIRMDIEGYEAELIPALSSVLETTGPLVLFFEIHPNVLGKATFDRLLDQLREHDFELVAAFPERITIHPALNTVYEGRLDDVPELDVPFNIIVKKPVSSDRASDSDTGARYDQTHDLLSEPNRG